ncbi:MAG: VTT domain-containing protein [Candidatus Paceibacterota bacterium]
MHTVEILNHFVENHQFLAYLVIFFGLIFEGEVVVITTGVLANLGALDFGTALIFVLAGGMAKTLGCYYLGTLIYRKYSKCKFINYLEKRVMYFMPRFKQKPFWSIFISKFISGINYIVLIFAGYTKVSLKTYLKAEILSTIFWAPLLLSLGFFFSQTALEWSKEISKFSLVIFFFVVAFIFFDKLVAGFWRVVVYMKNGIHNNENEDESRNLNTDTDCNRK